MLSLIRSPISLPFSHSLVNTLQLTIQVPTQPFFSRYYRLVCLVIGLFFYDLVHWSPICSDRLLKYMIEAFLIFLGQI